VVKRFLVKNIDRYNIWRAPVIRCLEEDVVHQGQERIETERTAHARIASSFASSFA